MESMKSTQMLSAAAAFLAVLFFNCTLNARIGETRQDLQNRMLTKIGGAYIYPSKEERLREALELPYKYAFLLMPKDAQNFFFFKRADSSTSTNSDVVQQYELYGWELHICFNGSNSAMEFYRRHGEPITVEELSEIFKAQIASIEGASWKKSDFINVVKNWNMNVKKNGIPSEKAESSKDIADILPKSATRFIYVEIPEEVLESTDYPQSLQSQIMEYEQRNAYDAYRKYLSKQSSINAAKTAPSSSRKKNNAPVANAGARKIYAFDAYTHKYVESDFDSASEGKTGSDLNRSAYFLRDIYYGGTPVSTPTKDVRLTMTIPNQPNTAFGYDYETSDGSIRAKIYKSGVLFIDSKFDARIREYMEKLYSQQSEKRAEAAKAGTSKF